jgi:hypothetical protein
MYRVEEKCIQGFGWEMRQNNNLGDLGIEGRIIL